MGHEGKHSPLRCHWDHWLATQVKQDLFFIQLRFTPDLKRRGNLHTFLKKYNQNFHMPGKCSVTDPIFSPKKPLMENIVNTVTLS